MLRALGRLAAPRVRVAASARTAAAAAAAAAPARRLSALAMAQPSRAAGAAAAAASRRVTAAAGAGAATSSSAARRALMTEAQAARSMALAGAGKKTTGIYGRDVIPNSREVLIDANEKLIAKAKELGNNAFNEYVIKSATYHLSVLNKHTDNNLIEAELEMGQMEDMVEAAENMMDLMVYLNVEAKEKPWLPDPEGDKEFKECFHPVFGDEEFEDEWAPAIAAPAAAAAAAEPKKA